MDTQADTKEEVEIRIREMVTELATFGVLRLGVLGSVLRGRLEEDSDVDVLVQFAPGKKTFDNFMRLADLLEARLRRRVELVTPESLSPYIGPRILATTEYIQISGIQLSRPYAVIVDLGREP